MNITPIIYPGQLETVTHHHVDLSHPLPGDALGWLIALLFILLAVIVGSGVFMIIGKNT